jgi:hypothetical protein
MSDATDKPVTIEDIEEAAKRFVDALDAFFADPALWGPWVIFPLEEADARRGEAATEGLLRDVRRSIDDRQTTGQW